MTPNQMAILDQLGGVLGLFYTAEPGTDQLKDVSDRQVEELFTLVVHALECFAPPGSVFQRRAREIIESEYYAPGQRVSLLVGVLEGLRDAYTQGILRSVQELVRAEVFDDFLETASYLLGEGYKDPAAVLVGGVLEEHLRKLCMKHGIPTTKDDQPKKAALLNDDLARAGAYPRLEQKNVTAWLDLRNKAAHGKYAEYDAKHVEYMLTGLKAFLTRYPA
jgi:hypothetical protein